MQRVLKTVWSRALSTKPHIVNNLVNGKWVGTDRYIGIENPLKGGEIIYEVADTRLDDLAPFIRKGFEDRVSRHGTHNPLYNVHEYSGLADVSERMAAHLLKPDVQETYADLIQVVVPKERSQAIGEIAITQKFLSNFSADGVRNQLARGFTTPGDKGCDQILNYRWPYGEVAVICPFNFPLEIPVLQLMGALYMGNRPTLHVDPRVVVVMERFLRDLHEVGGLDKRKVNLLNGYPQIINNFLKRHQPEMTCFTGSSEVADKLTKDLNGKIKIEDAGFNWKIVDKPMNQINAANSMRIVVDKIVKNLDKDAFDNAGQKCSAQSLVFLHKDWESTCLLDEWRDKSMSRNLGDLTVAPTISIGNEAILSHIEHLLAIDGAKIMFGGQLLKGDFPVQYGCIEPTLIYVPIDQIEKNFHLATKEIFAPFCVVTYYEEIRDVLRITDCIEHRLTCAIVSEDPVTQKFVLGRSTNGTTYVGLNARTTGAPQNHFFGPSGDPRGAGIGSVESIINTWSCNRTISIIS